MRGPTAKFLRNFARLFGLNYRGLKRSWNETPRDRRHAMMDRLQVEMKRSPG